MFIYQAFEYGHEGFISSQGFKSVMVHIFEMSNSECQKIFQDIDSDNDLKITFGKFYLFVFSFVCAQSIPFLFALLLQFCRS